MKQYRIISGAQHTVVETEVTKLLNEGWRPVGGVSVSYKHEHGDHGEHIAGHLVYAQAMEKNGE